MYILVNKVPVDVFKIKTITRVNTLSINRYKAARNRLEDPTFGCLLKENIKEEYEHEGQVALRILNYMLKDVWKVDFSDFNEELPEVEESEDVAYGYYFCLEPEDHSYLCSKIYKTEEEAEKKLKDLLEIVNEIRNVIVEVEI